MNFGVRVRDRASSFYDKIVIFCFVGAVCFFRTCYRCRVWHCAHNYVQLYITTVPCRRVDEPAVQTGETGRHIVASFALALVVDVIRLACYVA